MCAVLAALDTAVDDSKRPALDGAFCAAERRSFHAAHWCSKHTALESADVRPHVFAPNHAAFQFAVHAAIWNSQQSAVGSTYRAAELAAFIKTI